jgi:PKD repeat protein
VFDCEVTVQVYNPPTAVLEASKTTAKVGETIYFDATVSYDNDEGGEEIVEYLWDWNNDSVFLEGPGETTHSWTAIGTHYVQILITDDEMDIGMLDEPLEITIYF